MKKSISQKINYFLIILIAFFIPISVKVVSALTIVFVLNWLVDVFFNGLYINHSIKFLAILLVLFYFLHIICMLYSSNISDGISQLETKLSLLLFPIIFVSISPFNKDKKDIVFLSFVLGCFIIMIVCFSNALYNFLLTNEKKYFYYTNLSLSYHPGYLSMFMCFAASILFLYSFNEKRFSSKKWQVLFSILIFSFILFIILLSTKTSFIFLLFFFISTLYYLLKNNKIKTAILFNIATIILIGSILKLVPEINNRISAIYLLFNEKNRDLNIIKNSQGTIGARILVWHSTIEIIKENFIIGVGAGDVKDVLSQYYKEKEYLGVYKKKLNAHNQFLQTFAGLGIIGLIMLFACILMPLKLSVKTNDYHYIFFLLIIIIYFLTESVLERQSGIVFFSFFYSLLMFLNNVRN